MATEKHLLLTGSYDHTLRFWDLEQHKAIRTIQHTAAVNKIAAAPDMTAIAFASSDGNAYLFNLTSTSAPTALVAHKSPVVRCEVYASLIETNFS
jgi:WD40 repeat protein